MSDKVELSSHPGWLSEAVILAVSPALGYLSAYVYHAEYLRYFRIPTSLVDLSAYDIISSSLYLFLIGSFFAYSLSVIILIFKRYEFIVLISIFSIFLFDIWLVYLVGFEIKSGIYLFIAFFVLFAVILAAPTFLRGKRKYRHRLEEFIDFLKLDTAIFPRINIVVISSCFVLLAVLLAPMYLGQSHAKLQTDFLTFSMGSDFAVLGRSGDLLIIRKLYRSSHALGKDLMIKSLSDLKDVPLQYEKIGPLSLAKG